ncbi:MAG: 16S rRNA (adenine(1518)-N(6)/adenine(1519)-N(6))-dimethyltransferase RsmA [Candidatus Saccharibacteria bacterium]|nr:16S rRNA (adenine(1518)-N(6)/adenine(1519)-N(6))-dimethyltransferase RsmA [Candidatus Saccharibacteria bacterium]
MKNNKSLGQHWLKDRFILDEIAASAACDGVSKCLEIGPGLGTLTSSLLRVFDKVTAVEFDERLANNLPKSFPGKNLEVINEDILQFDLKKLGTDYVAAGNIPYYITSPIISKLLDAENKPKKIVLLIQKEVADRILANVGKHTVLSLSVQAKANVSPGVLVTKEYFTPPPKVDSATIILEPYEKPLVSDEVLDFIKIGFSSPRKKLAHNLPVDKTELISILESLGISPDARPADLSLEDWDKLVAKIKHK